MIRIIDNSTFGYWNGRSVEPKTKKSPPFSTNPQREAELVKKGTAEYVENAEDVTTEITQEYLEGLKLEKLKEVAGQFGVTYRIGTTKADFVNEVWAAFAPPQENAASAEAMAEDDVPAFDAVDAVV